MTVDSMRGDVVVASNRAAAGIYEDETGPLIVEFLTKLGFDGRPGRRRTGWGAGGRRHRGRGRRRARGW